MNNTSTPPIPKYSIILNNNSDTNTFMCSFEIQEGKYKGVVFNYGEFKEKKDGHENIIIEYNLTVEKTPIEDVFAIENDKDFQSITNGILLNILKEYIDYIKSS